MTAAITLDGVHLAYRIDRQRVGTFKEFAISLFKGQTQREELRAVAGVDLTVDPGEVLGVIGPNGAGKTTLMKLIARVLPPTDGRVVVHGDVAPLIALGAGFHPDSTARENVMLYGALLGRSVPTMRQRMSDIIGWAGLNDFADVPLRAYSSGMVARLAFSAATDMNADVLLIDEVLGVGDREFLGKSERRIERMIGAGSAVVIVSHALETVRRLCDRVLWMDHGRVRMLGATDVVVAAYTASVDAADSPNELGDGGHGAR